jgi:hypothetical protein
MPQLSAMINSTYNFTEFLRGMRHLRSILFLGGKCCLKAQLKVLEFILDLILVERHAVHTLTKLVGLVELGVDGCLVVVEYLLMLKDDVLLQFELLVLGIELLLGLQISGVHHRVVEQAHGVLLLLEHLWQCNSSLFSCLSQLCHLVPHIIESNQCVTDTSVVLETGRLARAFEELFSNS